MTSTYLLKKYFWLLQAFQSGPITKEGCPRHGKCCECVAHHKEHGKKLPACLRGREWEGQ